MIPVIYPGGLTGESHNNRCCDEDDESSTNSSPGMRKMSKREKEKFPEIVAGSIRCQQYYISRCEHCDGCNMAVDGCEKVCYMTAG